MRIFRFDRAERPIAAYDSVGLVATRIAAGEGRMRLTCLTVEAGGVIGTHQAPSSQMFLVTAGAGWVAGADGVRTEIRTGEGVVWDEGEIHTSGTDGGLTALVVEGAPLALFEPEA
ncbi:hypothetical protein [Catenulispora pinisilvae]|uniref:hypothetical protein n=1 Tax=Catenulispora pinisilvae TaxID=2705253 RepID=UPI001E59439A|nr:hypothetical protein [Catenulispora pinisilvae]